MILFAMLVALPQYVMALPPQETINLFSLLPQCQYLMEGQKW